MIKSRRHKSKLTVLQIKQIVHDVVENKFSQIITADKYHISPQLVNRLVKESRNLDNPFYREKNRELKSFVKTTAIRLAVRNYKE